MSRVSAPARLIALAAVLVLPFLALVAPAQADDPAPTPTRVSVTPDVLLDNETTMYLAADVSCCNGRSGGITGTFTFRDDTGAVLATDVAPSADNGYAVIYPPKPTRQTTFYVDFHGTNGYADSTGSAVYTPHSRKTVNITAEPTILRVTGGLVPQLTLTLAATARLQDGTPVQGIHVEWDAPCIQDSPKTCHVLTTWCSAVTDANGLASCKGAGLLGSLVSILNGAVVMYADPTNAYNVTPVAQIPPVVVRS